MRHVTLAALAICCCLSAVHAAPVQKWEYAMLVASDTNGSVWKVKEGQGKIGEGNKRESMYAIFQHLGGQGPLSGFGLSDLLNAAGEQGWELINIRTENKVDTYIFKRPLR